MGSDDAQQEKAYVLGRTEREAQRLRDQAKLLEEFTQITLSQIGLTSGMACLDVGCGSAIP